MRRKAASTLMLCGLASMRHGCGRSTSRTFKHKLTQISRELYQEHGWQMPKGLARKGERNPTNFTLEEWQQGKRAQVDPKVVKREIQSAWEHSRRCPVLH
jgi:hypothetical protein